MNTDMRTERIALLQAVLDVALLFAQERDLELLLNLIVQKAVFITQAERGCVALVQDDTVSLPATHNLPDDEGQIISTTAIRQVLEKNQAETWVDLGEAGDELSAAESVLLSGLKSIMCAPLRVQGKTLLGALYVDTTQSPPWPESPVYLEVFEALAAQAAVALETSMLHQQIITDPLTGVYSRGYFEMRLAEEIAQAQRSVHPLSIILVDLDGLHSINEDWGYIEGDRTIRTLAKMLKARASDLTFRIGGDEFIVLLPDTPAQGVHAVRARLEGNSSLLTKSQEVHWRGIGLGIATFPQDGQTPAALYNAADNDLHRYRGRSRRKVPYDWASKD